MQLILNGQSLSVQPGISVAAAIENAGETTRVSVSGQARAPFCGMGVCHECRVLINGQRRLACQVSCEDGMQVSTV
jgi:D-hydroxyproline dehydrogenase subunit gamma